MRRLLVLLGLLALGVFLLINPVTGIMAPPATEPDAAAPASQPTTTTEAPPGVPVSTTIPNQPATTTSTTASARVFLGPKVWSEWGWFQVQITVADGVITDAELVEQPSDRKSVRINQSAVPRYVAQTLETQSADLDLVSGATFTWRYFRESLAGAMELAGIVVPTSA